MITRWTTKGNRDAGSSCSCDGGLQRHLWNFGGEGDLNPQTPLGTPLNVTILYKVNWLTKVFSGTVNNKLKSW